MLDASRTLHNYYFLKMNFIVDLQNNQMPLQINLLKKLINLLTLQSFRFYVVQKVIILF